MKLRAYIAALHAALFAILLAISPAGSGSMTLLGAGKPAAGGGGGSCTINFTDSASANTNVAATDYGTRVWNSGQVLVIALPYISNNPGTTVSGIIAGANTLMPVPGAATTLGAAFSATVDVWRSTGNVADSGGDITVTYSNSPNPFGIPSSIGVYSIATTTAAPGTPVGATASSAASISATGVNIPSGCGAIAVLSIQNSGSSFSSWTGATSSHTTNSVSAEQVVAQSSTTGASVTITANLSPNDGGALVVVPWSP